MSLERRYLMPESTIVYLGCGPVEVEYNYSHKDKTIDLISVCCLQDPEKHLREATINVIKAQIHFYEKSERDSLLVSVLNDLK